MTLAPMQIDVEESSQKVPASIARGSASASDRSPSLMPPSTAGKQHAVPPSKISTPTPPKHVGENVKGGKTATSKPADKGESYSVKKGEPLKGQCFISAFFSKPKPNDSPAQEEGASDSKLRTPRLPTECTDPSDSSSPVGSSVQKKNLEAAFTQIEITDPSTVRDEGLDTKDAKDDDGECCIVVGESSAEPREGDRKGAPKKDTKGAFATAKGSSKSFTAKGPVKPSEKPSTALPRPSEKSSSAKGPKKQKMQTDPPKSAPLAGKEGSVGGPAKSSKPKALSAEGGHQKTLSFGASEDRNAPAPARIKKLRPAHPDGVALECSSDLIMVSEFATTFR